MNNLNFDQEIVTYECFYKRQGDSRIYTTLVNLDNDMRQASQGVTARTTVRLSLITRISQAQVKPCLIILLKYKQIKKQKADNTQQVKSQENVTNDNEIVEIVFN